MSFQSTSSARSSGSGQHGQPRQPGDGSAAAPRSSTSQVAEQPLHGRRVEQAGLVRALDPQAGVAGLGQEAQVELGRVDADDQVGEAERPRRRRPPGPGRARRRSARSGRAARGSGRARRAAPRPAWRTAGPGGRRRRWSASLSRASSSRERRVAGQVAADRQRVDQEPDERGQLGAAAVGAGGADDQVVLAGVAVQQRLEGGHQRDEQRRALAAAQLPQVRPAARGRSAARRWRRRRCPASGGAGRWGTGGSGTRPASRASSPPARPAPGRAAAPAPTARSPRTAPAARPARRARR